jgi:glycine cleavage system aminomethyltransferase T
VPIGNSWVRVIRASYCGGLGYELHVPTKDGAASQLYRHLQDSNAATVTEIGYRALQTMRTEAARSCLSIDLPLGSPYIDCTPKIFAKLGDDQADFVGKDAIKHASAGKFLVHLSAADPHFFIEALNANVPPLGGRHRIFFDGHDVGYVTSGFYGFRAGRAVMLAMIDKRPDLGLTGKKAVRTAELGRLRVSDETGAPASPLSVVENAEDMIAS